MTEENQKNTVATVGMRFSIIGLILFISAFLVLVGNALLALFGIMGFLLCFPLLFIGFILGIIGLFHKPRGKARVAVVIPLIVFIAFNCLLSYAWKSVEVPANEFLDRAKPQLEQFENDENFDGDRFGDILELEFNEIANDTTEDDWKVLFNSSTGSNSLEKFAYALSSLAKEGFENALERYNNGEVVEINDEDNNIISVDIDIKDENEEDIEDTEEEITIEQPKKTNNETFSQSEKNDIEEILDILE